MNYNKHKKLYRFLAWLLFGFYVISMIYFLFFAEIMGRTMAVQEYHYNLEPFKEIRRFLVYYRKLGFWPVAVNLVGNVLAFVPFGLFFPLLSRRSRSFVKVTLISCEVSISVELIQLLTRVGSCDVDDIILNTLGGMLGYMCFRIVWAVYKKNVRKS